MANFRDLDDALELLIPAYDMLGDAVNIIDIDGVVVYANPACECIYGFSPSELVNQHISKVMKNQADEITVEMIQASENQVWKGQVERQRKNGKFFQADITVFLLIDNSGNFIGRTAILRDVSEFKRMEGQVQDFEAQRGRNRQYRKRFARH